MKTQTKFSKLNLKTMSNLNFLCVMKTYCKTLLLAILAIWIVACQKEEKEEKRIETNYFDAQRYSGVFVKEDLRVVKKVQASLAGAGEASAGIPSYFDLTPKMPPVHPIGQGYNGACISWASSAIVSYLQHIKNNTPYTEETIMSPSYLYSQLRKKDDYGREISEYLPTFEVLKEQGVCTMSEKTFNEYDIVPNQYQRQQAKYNRIADYKGISFSQIREYIAKGMPILVGFYLSGGEKGTFRLPYVDNQNRRIWNRNSNQETYAHAAVIVGYSEQYYTIYNSWGTMDEQGRYNGLIYVKPDVLEEALQRHYGVETLFVFYSDNNQKQDNSVIEPAPTPDLIPQKVELLSSQNNIEFGQVQQQTLREQRFELTATGGDVEVISLQVNDTYNYNVDTYSFDLRRGQSKSLTLRFKPKEQGTLSSRIEITYRTKGMNESKMLYINISGISIRKNESTPRPIPTPTPVPKPEPRISINTNYLSFQTEVGDVSQQEIDISNTGEATANIRMYIEGDSAFQLGQSSELSLWAHSNQRIFVNYQPQEGGYHNATLVINFNNRTERVNLSGRAQQRRVSYVLREERPYSDLSSGYCGDINVGVTYANHIGIDEQNSSVEEIGNNQLRITLKVVKTDRPTFTHSGSLFAKVGENFCTRQYTEESYRGGGRFVNITFTMDKSQNTVWVLAKSDNGYRFYTKVRVERQ